MPPICNSSYRSLRRTCTLVLQQFYSAALFHAKLKRLNTKGAKTSLHLCEALATLREIIK